MQAAIPYQHRGLSGALNVKLWNNQTLDEFCMHHIPDYDPDRFEAIAIRMYSGKEVIITVYALDKSRQEGSNYNPDKLPVKKFKIDCTFDLVGSFEEFNFTLSTGNYDIEDMEVINK